MLVTREPGSPAASARLFPARAPRVTKILPGDAPCRRPVRVTPRGTFSPVYRATGARARRGVVMEGVLGIIVLVLLIVILVRYI